jgi:hypothetical protein
MVDKFGRLCPTCGEPMTRAAKFDRHGEDGIKTAFACQGWVMMLAGRPVSAHGQDWPAGDLAGFRC